MALDYMPHVAFVYRPVPQTTLCQVSKLNTIQICVYVIYNVTSMDAWMGGWMDGRMDGMTVSAASWHLPNSAGYV